MFVNSAKFWQKKKIEFTIYIYIYILEKLNVTGEKV